VAQFCFGVGIVCPAIVFHIFKNNAATREGKILGRVQVGPFDAAKGVLRLDHLERARADVYVERAVEIGAQVESAGEEDRTLAVERPVGVVR